MIFLDRKHYLGITGCKNKSEISKCLNLFGKYQFNKIETHLPSINILLSYKLNNPSNLNQFIKYENIFEILMPFIERDFLIALHYNTHNEFFFKEIDTILSGSKEGIKVNELIDAIQLNVSKPNVAEVSKIKKKFPELALILQINKSFFNNSNPTKAQKIIDNYLMADYFLIDRSEGKGVTIDLYSSNLVNFYKALYSHVKRYQKKVVFAGGFDGENVKMRFERISNLIGTNLFSIDAQGKLRDRMLDELDYRKVSAYISNYVKSIRGYINEHVN